MRPLLKTQSSWLLSHPRLLAAVASLLAAALVFVQGEAVNNDAYTYVRVAELFLHDGVGAAFAHYPWASYSALLAHFVLLDIDLFSAGLLLNAFFYALSAVAFVGLCSALSSKWPERERNRALLFAVAVICVYPQLNEYRSMLLRDVGFWAFTLLALQQLITLSRLHVGLAYWRCVVAFVLFLGAALLFRAEAIIYLLCSPVLLLALRDSEGKPRYADAGRLAGFIAATGLAVAVIAVLAGLDIGGAFARFIANYQPFIDALFNGDTAQRSALNASVLADHALLFSQSDSLILRGVGAVYSLGHAVVAAISLPFFFALTAAYLLRRRTEQAHINTSRDARILILGYALVNLAILCGFALVTRFVSGRYVMLLGLLVVLWLPLVLARWQSERASGLSRSFFALFFIYCAVDSFISFGRDKAYLSSAEAWVSQYGSEYPSTMLISNSRRLAYASDLVEDYDLVPSIIADSDLSSAPAGTLLAIELNPQMRARANGLLSTATAETIAVFPPSARAENQAALNESVRVAILIKR